MLYVVLLVFGIELSGYEGFFRYARDYYCEWFRDTADVDSIFRHPCPDPLIVPVALGVRVATVVTKT